MAISAHHNCIIRTEKATIWAELTAWSVKCLNDRKLSLTTVDAETGEGICDQVQLIPEFVQPRHTNAEFAGTRTNTTLRQSLAFNLEPLVVKLGPRKITQGNRNAGETIRSTDKAVL